VKRSGRDEPIGVVIHICMETTEGISLSSYLYLKLAKMPFFFFIIFYIFLLQNWRIGGWNRFCLGVFVVFSTSGRREVVGKGVGG
jgi:hypothetical protein